MPFTLAHPAAVLPLARPPFKTLALIAGALAPDAPYLIRATAAPVTAQSWYEPFANATTSHALSELISTALPLALVLYLFLVLAMPPAHSLLPHAQNQRRRSVRGSNRPSTRQRAIGGALNCIWIAVSLVVGILTHLAWDAFTDADGHIVTNAEFLTHSVGGMTWDRLLQHLSTGLGLLVLALVGWRHRNQVVGVPASPSRRRLQTAAASCVVAAVLGVLVTTRSWLDPSPALSTGEIIEGALADAVFGAGLAIAVLAALGTITWWAWHLVKACREHIRQRSNHDADVLS